MNATILIYWVGKEFINKCKFIYIGKFRFYWSTNEQEGTGRVGTTPPLSATEKAPWSKLLLSLSVTYKKALSQLWPHRSRQEEPTLKTSNNSG